MTYFDSGFPPDLSFWQAAKKADEDGDTVSFYAFIHLALKQHQKLCAQKSIVHRLS
jgi:hypothetical protein